MREERTVEEVEEGTGEDTEEEQMQDQEQGVRTRGKGIIEQPMQQKRSCELRANEYEMKSTLAAVGGELSGLQPLTPPTPLPPLCPKLCQAS